MTLERDVQQAIPCRESKIKVDSWEDLQYLGRQSVEHLINSKENELPKIKKKVSKLKSNIALLSGKSGEDIEKMAEGFTDPQIPQETLAISAHSRLRTLGPTREVDLKRARGSTTYNNCGWCTYNTDGGLGRYAKSTECAFLTYAGRKCEDRGVASVGCLLTRMNGDEINSLVTDYRLKEVEEEASIRETRGIIAKMTEVALQAEEKPPLASLRPKGHFNIGDRVRIYTSKEDESCFKFGFMKATVYDQGGIYNHSTGHLSLFTDEPVHTEAHKEGRGFSFGSSSAYILLESEFNYLRENPDFAKAWIDNSPPKLQESGFKEALLAPQQQMEDE